MRDAEPSVVNRTPDTRPRDDFLQPHPSPASSNPTYGMEPSSTTSNTKSAIVERLKNEEGSLSDSTVSDLEQLIERIVEDKTDVPTPLWDVRDVATRLNVGKRTVENIIADGKLTAIWVRGQRRFEPEAVEAYIRRSVNNKV